MKSNKAEVLTAVEGIFYNRFSLIRSLVLYWAPPFEIMKHITLRTHEVQQIIAGRQTRLSRPVKLQPEDGLHNDDQFPRSIDSRLTGWNGTVMETGESKEFKCPFGKVGEVIACKEMYRRCYDDEGCVAAVRYKADFSLKFIPELEEDCGTLLFKEDNKWISQVTMPPKACRLWLKVKEIRCEKIQDITEEGAKAEGVKTHMTQLGISYFDYETGYSNGLFNARRSYESLHKTIYGPESWDLNEWFWILIFDKTDKP